MNPEIRETPFAKLLYGRSKAVLEGQKPVDAMFAAMNETWGIVRAHGIPNGGANHIVYTNAQVFAGLEVAGDVDPSWGLQPLDLALSRYVYYRHVGAYDLLGQAYASIGSVMDAKVLQRSGLSVEIYGHWSEDPAKLVTELLVGIK